MAPRYRFALTSAHIKKALNELADRHAHVAMSLKQVGYPSERRQPHGFEPLARIVVGQQVSTKAAQSIAERLRLTLGGTISAEAVLSRQHENSMIGAVAAKFEEDPLTRRIASLAPDNSKLELMRLALILHYEKAARDDSPWGPYIDHLPGHTPNSLFLDESAIKAHLTSVPRASFLSLVEQDQRFFDAYASSLFVTLDQEHLINSVTMDEFLASLRWGYSTMMSRAHFLREWGISGPVCMIDFANHDGHGGANAALDIPAEPLNESQRQERARWHMEAGASVEEADEAMVLLTATRSIEADQEILIDYNCDTNEALLRSYGFADSRCPDHDDDRDEDTPSTVLCSEYTS